jgi:hypothetical protein
MNHGSRQYFGCSAHRLHGGGKSEASSWRDTSSGSSGPGSLSATNLGHWTERAPLPGIIGKEPATVDSLFVDNLGEFKVQGDAEGTSAVPLARY